MFEVINLTKQTSAVSFVPVRINFDKLVRDVRYDIPSGDRLRHSDKYSSVIWSLCFPLERTFSVESLMLFN